jgi:hypothetical protein
MLIEIDSTDRAQTPTIGPTKWVRFERSGDEPKDMADKIDRGLPFRDIDPELFAQVHFLSHRL